jgi:Zn-dependent peptidase ImmA (M78 family)
MYYETKSKEYHSVLANLRSLIPDHPVTLQRARRVAERQAVRLLRLTGHTKAPVPMRVITERRRIVVRTEYRLPVRSTRHWDILTRQWIITLCADDTTEEQRFSLVHEYARIVHYGHERVLFGGDARHTPQQQAEQIADHVARCVLMPARLVRQAVRRGLIDHVQLAAHFEVSPHEALRRLTQLGVAAGYDAVRSASPPRRRDGAERSAA